MDYRLAYSGNVTLQLQVQAAVMSTFLPTLQHNIPMVSHSHMCTILNSTGLMAIENNFSGVPLDFVICQKQNEEKTPRQRRYTETMKLFSQTLYFYSPKASAFVRKCFTLPNPRTIRTWLFKYSCNPGLLKEVFMFLKEECIKKPYIKNSALILDAISIRKKVIWSETDGKYFGYCDFGGTIDTDSQVAASEALVFLIVSYKMNFKCPVGYFLTNKTDASIQAELLPFCIKNVCDIGITVRSITCDGTTCNIQTLKNMGCKISAKEVDSNFLNPCTSSKVHGILDECHMLELAGYSFAEKNLSSPLGAIKCEYIIKLNELQEKEELTFFKRNVIFSEKIYSILRFIKNSVMLLRES